MKFASLITLYCGSWIGASLAWTGAIYSEIAWEAYQETTSVGRRFLKHHLGDDVWGIAKAAAWADYSQNARKTYPDSAEWHFSHTPYRDCKNFDMKRDCGFGGSGKCLVTGIADMVLKAIDPLVPIRERADAIRFVLHLMADIHQPLHTGFAKDAGGTDLIIETTSNSKMSLHQFWDFSLLSEKDLRLSEDSSSQISRSKTSISIGDSIESREQVLRYASKLASESSTGYTCKFAYTNREGQYVENQDRLTNEHIESRPLVAQERVADASRRLAELITAMAESFFAAKFTLIDKTIGVSRNQSSGARKAENAFAVLEVDIIPEHVAAMCEELIELAATSSPKQEDEKDDASLEITDMELLDRAIEDAVRQRAALKIDSEPSFPSTIASLPLSSFILITRNEHTFLTIRENLISDPDYLPRKISPHVFRLGSSAGGKRRVYSDLYIDSSCINAEDLERSDLEIILNYLDKRDFVAPMSSPPQSSVRVKGSQITSIHGLIQIEGKRVENGRILSQAKNLYDGPKTLPWFTVTHEKAMHSLMDFSALIGQETDPEAKADAQLDLDFYSKLQSIITCQAGQNMEIFLHIDTARSSGNNVHRKLNLFIGYNPFESTGQYMILIDSAIFDGHITHRIQQGLQRLKFDMRAIARAQHISDQVRLELQDLHKVLNMKESRRMQVINDLIQYPSPNPRWSFRIVEWDVKLVSASNSTVVL